MIPWSWNNLAIISDTSLKYGRMIFLLECLPWSVSLFVSVFLGNFSGTSRKRNFPFSSWFWRAAIRFDAHGLDSDARHSKIIR